jgi:hypothetical protein
MTIENLFVTFALKVNNNFVIGKNFVLNVLPASGSAWICIHFQSWILIRIHLKILNSEPDPHKVDSDPKHWKEGAIIV